MQGGSSTTPACRGDIVAATAISRQPILWLLLVGLFITVTSFSHYAHASARPGGDLAPLSNPDGVLNAGDILILQRIVMGAISPSQEQILVGDVAPLGAPDGVLNAADVVVLTRAVLGQVQLSPVYLGPDSPILDSYPATTTANPALISGTAAPCASINLYVAGLKQGPSVVVDGAGHFSLEAALNDGANAVYATAVDTSGESAPSNTLQIDYLNEIPRNQSSTTITQNTVWSPGASNAPYTIEDALTVANGVTLTILPGTTLSFGFGASLEIHGCAQIVGTPTQPIIFSSDSPSVQVGDWRGILIHEDAVNVEVRHAHIEWADYGIHDFGATNVTLANNSIENMKYGGIYVENGATTLIEANTILTSGTEYPRVEGRGIEVVGANPVIQSNTISGHAFGVTVWAASSPIITALNRITGNETGIAIWGDYYDSSKNPNPVITGNSIYQNASYNVATEGYVDPVDPYGFVELMYDYSRNWWGSANPSDISEKIYDFNRASGSYSPVVKLVPFLDAENGNPVVGNFLNGLYTNNLSLSSGTPYVVVGSFVIGRNAVLEVSEGARLEFAKKTSLNAIGAAHIIGLPTNPVVLTSYETAKAADDWSYVTLFGAGSIFAFAQIEYLKNGIDIYGANTVVSNTSVRHFQTSGINVKQPVSVTIASCHIEGDNRTGTGISVSSSEAKVENNTIENTNWGVNITRSPTVRGNAVTNNTRGIQILRGNSSAWADNPTIESNQISANDYGIYIDAYGSLTGDPNPAIHNNEIYGNAVFNIYAQDYHPSVFVDAILNWWGTEDENQILAGLNSPQINYSPYKNASGQPVYSQRFAGVLSADVDIAPGEIRQVTSSVIIPPGITLSIGAGARLEFAPEVTLVVNGDLAIASDGSDPVIFTSSISQPQWYDYWGGLVINVPGIEIHDIKVENAKVGMNIYADNVTLRDSVFTGCRDICVAYNGQYPSKLQTTLERLAIDVNSPSAAATGLNFIHTEGRLSGSIIRNGYKGIAIRGLSSLLVEKNLIENNTSGIYVTSAVGAYNYWPTSPIVHDNNIENNLTHGYETAPFTTQPTAVLNATNNWWGTTTESAIQAAIWDETDASASYPLVTYAPYHTTAVALPPRLNPLPGLYTAASLDVTGQAAPSANVQIYVNTAYTTTAVADPAGTFSASVPIDQGVNVIYAVDTSGAVPSYPSRSYSVVRDTLAPIISLTSPLEGTLTNQYAMTFTGSVNEPATLTLGGAAVAVDSAGNFSHGPVYLAEGANAISLIATDPAGNTTTHTLNLTLDSTPPADPVMSLISFGTLSGGTVSVTGAPGAIESGAILYLTNARSGETVQLNAATDGSFTSAIGAQPGDSLALLSADALGNQTPWHTQTVAGTPATLALQNIQPTQGTVITGAHVRITGTWQGPANTGISINGQVADTTGDRFLVNAVPLEPGSNTVEIIATSPDGATTRQTLTLTRTGDLPLSVEVEQQGYGPPYLARVTLTLNDQIQQISLDQDGDGGSDWSATNVTDTRIEINLNYASAGLHEGLFQGTDSQGTAFSIPFGVVLETSVGTQAKRRHVYQQMLDRLGQNDIPGALNQIMATSRDLYEQAFNHLTDSPSVIVSNLGTVDTVDMGGSWAQLRVVRDVNGQKRAYFVTLVRSGDGVWRIEGM